MPYTTGMWKVYLKHLHAVSTIDLPLLKGGPSTEQVMGFGSDRHIEVDLNYDDFSVLTSDLIKDGLFDAVIATEVVEHLQRDFAEVAAFMLNCLSPNGVAVVSTPNAVNETNMLYMFNGRNPHHRFLDFNSNRGGHFHFREYSIAEMLEDLQKIGARPILQAYSACWDDSARFKAETRYHLRSNTYLIFGRKEAQTLWN
jgi:hypothetical protein